MPREVKIAISSIPNVDAFPFTGGEQGKGHHMKNNAEMGGNSCAVLATVDRSTLECRRTKMWMRQSRTSAALVENAGSPDVGSTDRWTWTTRATK